MTRRRSFCNSASSCIWEECHCASRKPAFSIAWAVASAPVIVIVTVIAAANASFIRCLSLNMHRRAELLWQPSQALAGRATTEVIRGTVLRSGMKGVVPAATLMCGLLPSDQRVPHQSCTGFVERELLRLKHVQIIGAYLYKSTFDV